MLKEGVLWKATSLKSKNLKYSTGIYLLTILF